MNDIDKKIQAALKGDAPRNEQNIAEEVIGAFRGRNRAALATAFAFSLIVFGFSIWTGARFFEAELPSDQIQYGFITLVLLLVVSFIKVYFWLEMHTNRVLREMKRVELLLLTRTNRK